jgi:hypothetical protein
VSWQTVPFHDYGGLDLVSSPDNSRCIDMLNVDLDVRGAVRARDGYATFITDTSALNSQPDSLFTFVTSGGTKRLLVGHTNHVAAFDINGATVTAGVLASAGPHFFTRFGGPTAEAVYIGNGTDGIQKFTIDAFSSPGTLSGQTGKFVAITPTSNRLVVARESGTTAGNNVSSVNFSDAGAPETFTATNFVDLDPGDGEAIMGLVSWGNNLFAFKETKFYVFTHETVDTTGEPIFNYRKVDTGIGLVASRGLCAARDGVYFVSRTGVYRTTGGPPELVSRVIDPLFIGGASSFYQGSRISQASISGAAMAFHSERLYLAVPTGSSTTNDRTLVYDPRYGEWLVWNIAAAGFATFRITEDQPELLFSYATGDNYVARHSSSYTTDAGSAIVSRCRTGFYDLGVQKEKRLRAINLWGTGAVDFKVSNDFGSLGDATSATLGTAPAVDRSQFTKGQSGTLFSHQFSASSGAWTAHRCAVELEGTPPPGVVST